MLWSHDLLLDKAKLYAERAFSEQRTSPLFPLWATIALEFLGRAALAKIHPSLLAESGDRNNLLYVFEYRVARQPSKQPWHPKSIAATTVFKTCQTIIPDFTTRELRLTSELLGKRNEELHSGGLPYKDYPTSEWLAKYFKVCKLLLDFQGLSLDDFLGQKDGKIAQQMIEAAAGNKKGEVLKRIAAYRTIFDSWSSDKQRERQMAGKPHLSWSKVASCPSCGSPCRIAGEEVQTIGRLKDETTELVEVFWEIILLPTRLKCYVCNLELNGHESLHIARLGDQFSIEAPMAPDEVYSDYYDESDHITEPPWW